MNNPSIMNPTVLQGMAPSDQMGYLFLEVEKIQKVSDLFYNSL
jgi:hypothetical protein